MKKRSTKPWKRAFVGQLPTVPIRTNRLQIVATPSAPTLAAPTRRLEASISLGGNIPFLIAIGSGPRRQPSPMAFPLRSTAYLADRSPPQFGGGKCGPGAAPARDSTGSVVISGLTVNVGGDHPDILLSPSNFITAGQTVAITAASIVGN